MKLKGLEKTQTDLDPWSLYIYAMKAPMTRDRYTTRFAKFLDSIDSDEQKEIAKTTLLEDRARAFAKNATVDFNWAFAYILKFVQHLKERVDRKEITSATVRNYVKSIKLFCEMADIPIPWKKITRGLPKGKKYSDDRIPTIDELRKLLEYPDRRIKAIVYTMSSSGIRVGAWDYLRWGHVKPITRDGEVVAAKLLVYAGEDEEYFCFISAEAWNALKDWMEYREDSGEQINEQSWVMRNLWDTRVAQGRGFVTRPKKLSSLGVKRLMERAIWAQGLRVKLEPGKRRHPFQANHSLRKWLKTRCEIAGMKPINIEVLLNHSTGISDAYYRATESELLQDYLKAVDALTINVDKSRLQKQIEELKQESEVKEYIMRGKLQEKERAIQQLNQRDSMNSEVDIQKKLEDRDKQILDLRKKLDVYANQERETQDAIGWLSDEIKEMTKKMEILENKTAQAAAASGLLSKLDTALTDRSRRCSCEAQTFILPPGE